ncbi:MAG: hypothetical protein ACRYFU_19230, partial [Janthinobacterium lividum]
MSRSTAPVGVIGPVLLVRSAVIASAASLSTGTMLRCNAVKYPKTNHHGVMARAGPLPDLSHLSRLS